MNTKQPRAPRFQNIQELRLMLLAFSALRDAVLNYASLSYVPGERPDADILRARMQKAVDQVLGKGEARVALASVIVFQQ